MPELDFAVEGVEAEAFAAVPTLNFALRIKAPGQSVRHVALNTQVRIEPARRGYGAGEHERLSELFGERQRWGQTLRSFLWAHVALAAPAFEEECVATLPLPCSRDFDIAATKYFEGLADGEIPLSFHFSGSVFYDDADGALQIAQIAWTKDADFAMPAALWRGLMDRYYPGAVWLRVPSEVFERLGRYKRRRGFTDWSQALASLVPEETLEPAP